MKKPKENQQQVKAFRKAARGLGADEAEEAFDVALKKVAKHKPPPTDKKLNPAKQ